MPDTKTKSTKTPKEGITILVSSGEQIEAMEITADRLYDLQQHNMYAQSVLKDQLHLVFSDDPVISVLDANGELAEDATNDLRHMITAPAVNLWQKNRLLYSDIFFYGSWLSNPVWDWVDNLYSLQELNYLPASSFGTVPSDYQGKTAYSLILKGIILNGEEVEYWQTQQDGMTTKQVQVKNIFHVRNPDTPELAGLPIIMPVLPYLRMLSYSWDTQMQVVNRAGAPIMALYITNPRPASDQNGNVSDIDYGNEIIQNWGKDTAYLPRDNMRMEILDVKLTGTAKQTIEMLEKAIYAYFSPKGLIQTSEGKLIGGSERSAQELILQYTRSIHKWIANALRELLQPFLDANGYEDHTLQIKLPLPTFSQPDIEMQQAKIGFETKSLTINERRALLGLPALNDEETQKLIEEFGTLAPAPTGMPQMLIQQQASEGESEMDADLRSRRDTLLKNTLEILDEEY